MAAKASEFNREYLVRLPLPLAQLYSRAFNAKDARAQHDNALYLFESFVKLATAPAVACYLQEVDAGRPRVAELDRLLTQLALTSMGQWVGMLRELSRHFGSRTDAATHPLGRVWIQLTMPRRDLAGIVALFRRIKNGPDGQPAGDQSCTLSELFDALVQYRNGVFGHGAARSRSARAPRRIVFEPGPDCPLRRPESISPVDGELLRRPPRRAHHLAGCCAPIAGRVAGVRMTFSPRLPANDRGCAQSQTRLGKQENHCELLAVIGVLRTKGRDLSFHCRLI
jgi:hypothetical protein